MDSALYNRADAAIYYDMILSGYTLYAPPRTPKVIPVFVLSNSVDPFYDIFSKNKNSSF